ncbi:globin domain-containing protein [Frigidibacter sp. ROC022]|uniref:globin domain-containing protein n=1 Tax=Frigidibacter sp. ROC022 TaxID=2971796 RepID=UPI00215A96F1|nr:globin domain-containing protein [Frigidibacter sp. ROC022]MCR8726224.1 globin domain-containing protein [Frigidibacter sp. ROC022]
MSLIEDTDIRLVQISFARIIPIRDHASQLFYEHLFRIAPELRPMFRNDIELQGTKLLAALGMIVYSLREPQKLAQSAAELGLRHAGYGVRPRHFAYLREALLQMLSDGLGNAFDAETRDAWQRAYDKLAGLMIAQMRLAAPRAIA